MQDVVAEAQLGIKGLAAEDRDGWGAPALSDRVQDVVGLGEAMQVEVIRATAAWDHGWAWAEDGAATAVSWLRHHTGMARACSTSSRAGAS